MLFVSGSSLIVREVAENKGFACLYIFLRLKRKPTKNTKCIRTTMIDNFEELRVSEIQ